MEGTVREQLDAYHFQVVAISGISLNNQTPVKNVNAIMRNRQPRETVLWHDAINNSISGHSTNGHRGLSNNELEENLKSLIAYGLRGAVYLERRGTRPLPNDFWQRFVGTPMFFLDMQYLMKKGRYQASDFKKLHLEVSQEVKPFYKIIFTSF